MSRVSWQRRLVEEEEEQVLEEVMRRSEWKVFTHGWEEADLTVESTFGLIQSELYRQRRPPFLSG